MLGTILTACIVIGVADGDSMKVQCQNQPAVLSIRMAEIDAPEIAHPGLRITEQPYGIQSKIALTNLCLKKPATVTITGVDRYRRNIAHVTCSGIDANAYQVRTGNAWSYLPKRHSVIPSLQASAQNAHIGLWSSSTPIKPSLWRKGIVN
jgi:endonuclease YncB( thermonuclease family)